MRISNQQSAISNQQSRILSDKKIRTPRHYDKYFVNRQDALELLKPSIAFFNKVEERDPAFNWSAVIATQKPSNYVMQFAKILKMQDKGDNYYTHGNGLPLLKESISDYFLASGIETNDKNIIIRGSLFNIMEEVMCTEEKSKNVLLPSPSFGYYAVLAKKSGHKPVTIDGDKESNYKISPRKLREALHATQSKFIIFNNPVNPTGEIYSKQELSEISKVIKDFPDVVVLCDEIFKDMPLDKGTELTSLASFSDIKNQVVTLSGVGKSRGLIAQRVSFAHIPEKIVEKLSSCLTGDISREAQIQAAVSLQKSSENDTYLDECRSEYNNKIITIKSKIKDINKMLYEHFQTPTNTEFLKILVEPQAASMLMISFKGLEGKIVEKRNIRKKLDTGLDVAHYLLDSVGVALSPAESFFMNPKLMALRLPIGYPKQELEQGFEQIKFALSKLKSDNNQHIQNYSQSVATLPQEQKPKALNRSISL